MVDFATPPDWDLKPDARLSDLPRSASFQASIAEVSVAVGAAKTILLHHRVKAFTGDDVVSLARLIVSNAEGKV